MLLWRPFHFSCFLSFLWTLVVKVLQCRIHIYNILCIKCGCFKRKLQPTSFLSAIWVPRILSAFLSHFWINKYFNSLSISCWSNIHKLECFCESSAFECLLHHLRKIAVVLNSKRLISSCWCYDIIFSGHSCSVCVITCNSDKVMNELSVAQWAFYHVSHHQTSCKRCCWPSSGAPPVSLLRLRMAAPALFSLWLSLFPVQPSVALHHQQHGHTQKRQLPLGKRYAC